MWSHEVGDTADSSELDGREDIELALIQLKIETLQRINEALSLTPRNVRALRRLPMQDFRIAPARAAVCSAM
jgi:hypothetical protein